MDNEQNGDGDYPGVQFTPPQGTIQEGETEGQAVVTWKKVGDKFTIVEFEGRPIEGQPEAQESESDPGRSDLNDMAYQG